ncbi:hypothetical protein ABPG72_013834 [Tetrahymena utriculariae]
MFSSEKQLEISRVILPNRPIALDDPIYNIKYLFQLDNSPIHTSQKIINFFKNNNLRLMEWPPFSPDISPIEHLWFILKNIVSQQFDEIDTIQHIQSIIQKSFFNNKQILDAIKHCIEAASKRLNQIISNKRYPIVQ